MTKRLNLTMADEGFDEIQRIANERNVSSVDVIRMFIKLGLTVAAIERDPNSELIIRQNGQDKTVILI